MGSRMFYGYFPQKDPVIVIAVNTAGATDNIKPRGDRDVRGGYRRYDRAAGQEGGMSHDRYSAGTCRLFAGLVSWRDMRVTTPPPINGCSAASSASAAAFG